LCPLKREKGKKELWGGVGKKKGKTECDGSENLKKKPATIKADETMHSTTE